MRPGLISQYCKCLFICHNWGKGCANSVTVLINGAMTKINCNMKYDKKYNKVKHLELSYHHYHQQKTPRKSFPCTLIIPHVTGLYNTNMCHSISVLLVVHAIHNKNTDWNSDNGIIISASVLMKLGKTASNHAECYLLQFMKGLRLPALPFLQHNCLFTNHKTVWVPKEEVTKFFHMLTRDMADFWGSLRPVSCNSTQALWHILTPMKIGDHMNKEIKNWLISPNTSHFPSFYRLEQFKHKSQEVTGDCRKLHNNKQCNFICL